MATDDRLGILIVEDGVVTADGLRRMLATQSDMVVLDIAATGQEGVRRAAELRPQVILMDVHLPDIDGLQATKLITSQSPESSVIMLTSEQRIEYLQEAMVAGAQGYVLKPVSDPQKLADTIRAARQRTIKRRALLPVLNAADELDRSKDEFLRLIAHELRQPVAAVAVAAAALGEAPGLGLAEQRALEALRRQASRLARLAEDVLVIARVEVGELPLRRSVVDLGSLVGILVRGSSAPARIGLRLPAEPLLVNADPERIGQVVDNLISNALKYSPGDTPIEVTVEGTADEASVEVRDYGVGLDPEDVEQLFAKYGRVRDPSTAGIEGVGLGLYLSRLLAESHDGSIGVSSPGRGNGATFTLRLPRLHASTLVPGDDTA
jgi:two-component system, sensor histidine kinase